MNLEDIAKKAGVSRSTVSRVINDDVRVAAATRARVWQVIEDEHFEPNMAARALVTRRSEVIGVIIPTSENIFFTDNSYWPMLLAGLGEATRAAEYAMLLWLGEVTIDDKKLMRRIASGGQMDGLVIASLTSDHPFYQRLIEIEMPFVMVEKPLSNAQQINYVTVDNVVAAEMAVDHLIGLGRRRIAHITGNMNISDAIDRLQGYKNALARANIPFDPNLVHHGIFGTQAGRDGMRALLPQHPDALFAAGDTIAIGALQMIRAAGLNCPDDMAVVGFDDIDVATQNTPNLTTVRQPVQRKGAIAASLLIDILQGKISGPQHILLPTELIIRGSCGAAHPTALAMVGANEV